MNLFFLTMTATLTYRTLNSERNLESFWSLFIHIPAIRCSLWIELFLDQDILQYYYSECIIHPGQPITIYDSAEFIGKSFMKAFCQANILKGFEVTGLYRVNENIFGQAEFLTSFVTDRPIENDEI